MNFRAGDHVKVKDGTELEGGATSFNWAGKVKEVYPKQKTCLVELDSITLDALDDSYLLDCIEEGALPFEYTFEWDELLFAERRDTEEERKIAFEKVDLRMLELDPLDEKGYDEAQQEKWIEEFHDSEHFAELNAYQQDSAGFIAETFMRFMYNYEFARPEDWTVFGLNEVCLYYVPRKVSDDMELFENYGTVLAQFLKFLGDAEYIDNARLLQKEALAIKDEIPKAASDPSNWGMAKSMVMGVGDTGYDLSGEDVLDSFLEDIDQLPDDDFEDDPSPWNKTINKPYKNEDPFKHIGRNEKITVKYADGILKENIKFKLVKKDLEDGKCKIVD